jgi:hypothetical protein
MENQKGKFIYKLLIDILGLALLSIFFLLLLEAVMPGYISSYLSFTKVVFFIILLTAAAIVVGKKFSVSYNHPYLKHLTKNKTAIFLAVIAAIIFANSLYKIGWLMNLGIVAATMVILYFLIQELVSE